MGSVSGPFKTFMDSTSKNFLPTMSQLPPSV
jgi:multimeric flavodoxin WrbA